MAEEYATTASQPTTNTLTKEGTFTPKSAKPSSGGLQVVENLLPNPLHDYASYNYLFSLKILTDGEFNNASYRGNTSGPWLARSASMTPEDRVEAFAGKFEYFIEDVNIKHLTGFDKSTNNTNAIGFSFKIIEPYSMGLFFQAIQTDALTKGHINYIDAPMLLVLEFKGHKNFENQMESIPKTTKYFPLKLRLIEMSVTQQGSVYDISAYPVNEYAFEQAKVTFTTSVSVVGQTVEEMLKTHKNGKSLENYLNIRYKDRAKDKKAEAVPDKYEIQFPDTPLGPNTIKLASLGFDLYNQGTPPFSKDNLVYENGVYKRGNLSFNPKEGEFKFAQNTDVINAINQVVLMSDYGRKALASVTADGFVKWWRIEVELKYISDDSNLPKTGQKPKTFIYRVVPYLVDSSFFLPPNEKRAGTEADIAQVVKKYSYIYSGVNIDILDFNINFKAGFYTTLHADVNQHNAGLVTQESRSPGTTVTDHNNDRKETQQIDGKPNPGKNEFPGEQAFSVTQSRQTNLLATGKETYASLAAKQFQDAITAGVDMVTVDLTILGDPYYIGDSGMGNYHAGLKSKYINSDDSMPWDLTEVHLLLNFRTPADINLETGMYDFSKLYNANQFSGLYRILLGESNFVRGKFTQKLRIMRVRQQESASGSGNLAAKGAFDDIAGITFDGPAAAGSAGI